MRIPRSRSISSHAKKSDSNNQNVKVHSKSARKASLSLNNICEMEEHLLSFDTIQDDIQEKRIYYIEEYDDHCEDFLKIERIIPLEEDFSKIVIFIILNIFTLLLINLLIIWFPRLKLKLIYSHTSINHATHLGITSKSSNEFHIIEIAEISLPDITGSHIRDLTDNNIKSSLTLTPLKTFEYKLFKYFFSAERKAFLPFKFSLNGTYHNIEKRFVKGLNKREVEYQSLLYGKCDIEIQVANLFEMTIKELTDPFYVFQIFSIILWLNNEYIKYALVIILSTIISLFVSVFETRKNLLNIKSMARYSCKVKVFRSKREELLINSKDLVPGDVFELPEDNFIIPCDCVVLNGTVIMNESILTGESLPVVKKKIPNTHKKFDYEEKSFVIFSGTKIIQKRSLNSQKILALVIRTGFNTEKGSLIRAILFPTENHFKFKEDSVSYIVIMTCLSLLGFAISLPFMISNNIPPLKIFLRALDLITTTVPPALPACIGIGISYALLRIKEKGIICINRDRVNEAGKINLICFDKTGTLTEDHLDVVGFRPVKYYKGNFGFDQFVNIEESKLLVEETFEYVKNKNNSSNSNNKCKQNENSYSYNKMSELKTVFTECLATCHSITKVKGKLIGDPIDIKMFESTNWVLSENLENNENYDPLISTYLRPFWELSINEKLQNYFTKEENYSVYNSEKDSKIENEIYNDDSQQEPSEEQILKSHYELGIIRVFDFSSKLQRMSVLVKNANEENYKVFCKGSPEKIRDLCKAETVPDNFNEILHKYTQKGFRVLALSFKLVKMNYVQSQQISREDVEKNLMFLGLMIVQNKLKTSTKSSIENLRAANMKMIMATGDNIMTAISVAKECLLINPDAKVYQLDLLQNEAKCENNYDDENAQVQANSNKKLFWNLIDNFEDEDESKKSITSSIGEETPSRFSETFQPEIVSMNSGERLSIIIDKREFNNENYTFVNTGKYRGNNGVINENSSQSQFEIEIENFDNIHTLNEFHFRPNNHNNNNNVIAITGNIFEILCKLKNKYNDSKREHLKPYFELYKYVLEHGFIYARMSPDNKTNLIEALKDQNYKVLMCGDGANDCGALRSANVGVSLGIEEASIAAHFTANKADISCIKTILIEGKAALVTTIQCFKYMMLYSVIQFSSVTLLVLLGTYLSDNQFLMSDLFLIFPLAVLIAKTEAYEVMTKEKPVEDLKSVLIISSILMQSLVQFLAQFTAYAILKSQNWFVALEQDEDVVKPSYENTVVFLISYIQYLITAVAFSEGKPFKQNFYSNYLLCAFLIVTFTHGYYLVLCSDGFSNWLFTLVYLNADKTKWVFKWLIFGLSICNFAVSLLIEKVVVKRISKFLKK